MGEKHVRQYVSISGVRFRFEMHEIAFVVLAGV